MGRVEAYTLIVTSCGRFDLLEKTLSSFFAYADIPPARTILIEDSGDGSVRDVAAPFPVEVIVNERRLGQMAAIDKAYGYIDTPLIFHCEDDWEFTRSGFIAESYRLLHALPQVSMIGLRDRASLNPLLRDRPTVRDRAGAYFLADPKAHPEYFSYSFNPGLRRLADYIAIGPFSPLGYEPDISFAFKQAGFQIAYLDQPAVRHIGDHRHVDDPKAPKRPKNQIQRWGRSLQKRLKRLSR